MRDSTVKPVNTLEEWVHKWKHSPWDVGKRLMRNEPVTRQMLDEVLAQYAVQYPRSELVMDTTQVIHNMEMDARREAWLSEDEIPL